jgi:hypothetical protein
MHGASSSTRRGSTPIAIEAVERFDAWFTIERETNGAAPQERVRRPQRAQPTARRRARQALRRNRWPGGIHRFSRRWLPLRVQQRR